MRKETVWRIKFGCVLGGGLLVLGSIFITIIMGILDMLTMEVLVINASIGGIGVLIVGMGGLSICVDRGR